MSVYDDYKNGNVTDDGFYNIETGALFFCSKPLVLKGETLKCLNCGNEATIKTIPSKSATYAPRSSEDQNRTDLMKFAFERQRRLKEAELKTDEDALNS